MTEPNWNEAPEGAQRYRKSLPSPWLKKDAAGVVCYFHELRRIWCRYPHGIGEEPFNGATPRPVDTCPDCGETGGHTERCNDQHMPLFQTEQGEEIERLKAEIEARDIPPAFDMPAFSTIDRSSLNYKAGWNAYRKAMIAASKGEGNG